MSSLIHIAEIAALIAMAYVVGWAIGYVVHRLVTRPATAAEAAISPERLAAAMGEAPDALVKAPIIVPVANDPPPAPPSPVAPAPEPSSLAEVVAIAAAPVIATKAPIIDSVPPREPALPPVTIAPVVTPPDPFPRPEPAQVEPVAIAPEPPPVAEPEPIDPAMAAGPELNLGPLPAPVLTVEPEPRREPEAVRAIDPEPQPAPIVPPEPEPVPFTATPALRPGEAWSGEIKGRAAAPFAPAPVEPEIPLEPATAEPPPEIAPAAIVPPAPPPEYDEDAAMRAIEGGWSRVKARAMPNAPELHDVGAAVAAATAAVEQVLAGTSPHANGKPKGLPRPRQAGKDNLRQINGLGALDESTLNNLGVFHFDQIAGWDQAEVLWMENHVFARGRIGREDWQDQARALAAAVAG